MAPANAERTYPPSPLSQDEVEALLLAAGSTVPGLRAQAPLAICWRAGARVSEALHLEVPDIDTTSGDLHLRVTKGRKPRQIALDPIGLGIQLRWLTARARLTRTPRSGFVFCNSSGKALTSSAVRQAALGHASLATTDRYVRHVAPEELLEAMRTKVWAPQDANTDPDLRCDPGDTPKSHRPVGAPRDQLSVHECSSNRLHPRRPRAASAL